jgi:hypothetical protein
MTGFTIAALTILNIIVKIVAENIIAAEIRRVPNPTEVK